VEEKKMAEPMRDEASELPTKNGGEAETAVSFEAARAALMERLAALSPIERLAECRRLDPKVAIEPWRPVPAQPATAEEAEWLSQLPPIERLAEARRLGIE
jgi:hypothetical protein